MKLYKFRPLANCEDLKRIKEIIQTGEFWCSKFYDMNDPMEGVYYSYNTGLSKIIFNEKERRVICSFSAKFENPIMWGYYANGFKGIAIEIDIDIKEEDVEKGICKKIKYIDNTNKIDIKEKDIEKCNIDNTKLSKIVDKILTTKLDNWEHEEEYRFIIKSEQNSHKIGKITRVYFGNPYGNITNESDITNNSKKLNKYLDLKEELKKFLLGKGIGYCNVHIENTKVIECTKSDCKN